MKILGRTLVILAAALIVVGITFVASRSSSATNTNAGFSQHGDFAQEQASGTAAQGNSDFRGGGERGRGGSGGFFSLLEVGKNLIIIAVIIAIVAPILHFVTKRKQRAAAEQPQAPPNPTQSA